MSSTETLSIGFSNKSVSTDSINGYLTLEQGEWGDKGKTTTMDIINAMSSMFFGTDSLELDCGYDSEDRSISTEIYVYPSRAGLSFRIGVTFGTLRRGNLELIKVAEAIDFKLDTSASLSHIPEGEVVYSWIGDVFNEEGDKVVPPIISDSSDKLMADKSVYGTIKVSYFTYKYTYMLEITPREDSPENAYQSTVWAVWDGGVEMLQISPPDGAEEDLTNDTNCNDRSIVNITPNPSDDIPTAPSGAEETVSIDYCLYGEGIIDE